MIFREAKTNPILIIKAQIQEDACDMDEYAHELSTNEEETETKKTEIQTIDTDTDEKHKNDAIEIKDMMGKIVELIEMTGARNAQISKDETDKAEIQMDKIEAQTQTSKDETGKAEIQMRGTATEKEEIQTSKTKTEKGDKTDEDDFKNDAIEIKDMMEKIVKLMEETGESAFPCEAATKKSQEQLDDLETKIKKINDKLCETDTQKVKVKFRKVGKVASKTRTPRTSTPRTSEPW